MAGSLGILPWEYPGPYEVTIHLHVLDTHVHWKVNSFWHHQRMITSVLQGDFGASTLINLDLASCELVAPVILLPDLAAIGAGAAA